jgi:hypothetical protein
VDAGLLEGASTVKTTITTEERTITHTKYTCDVVGCDYETEVEKSAKTHHATTHSFKKEAEIDGIAFYWFETAEDYRAFHQDAGDRYRSYEAKLFKGPGWYGLHQWTDSYENTYKTALSAASLADGWRDDIKQLEKKIADLDKNIKALDTQLM